MRNGNYKECGMGMTRVFVMQEHPTPDQTEGGT